MMQNIAFLTHYEQQKGGAPPMSTLTFRVELTRGEEAQNSKCLLGTRGPDRPSFWHKWVRCSGERKMLEVQRD
jgi:hypothetical protein